MEKRYEETELYEILKYFNKITKLKVTIFDDKSQESAQDSEISANFAPSSLFSYIFRDFSLNIILAVIKLALFLGS